MDDVGTFSFVSTRSHSSSPAIVRAGPFSAGSFAPHPHSARILRPVDKTASSPMPLDLERRPRTLLHPGQTFGHVQPLAGITGFAEARSLSADGSTLHYHQLVGSVFLIESVSRPPTPWRQEP
ncbi:MAG TPA: hypothetical protein VNC61_16460 [Acidimicrobiales bacterium]|nr:hypothetical protein [Acidimicrobiales bacterium]